MAPRPNYSCHSFRGARVWRCCTFNAAIPRASIVIAYYTFISLVSLLRPRAPRVATIIRSASHGLR